MQISIEPALPADQSTIQNLARFYIYDMSRYCGRMKGWETPSNGLYECFDLSRYWKEPNRYPFLIKMDGELAGFALINKIGSVDSTDWNMGEFFIISKFQRKGVGQYVAENLFKRFPGLWEVMQIPENKAGILFWENVIQRFTQGNYEKKEVIIAEPLPHPMIALSFHSNPTKEKNPVSPFQIYYQENLTPEEEALFIKGLNEEAIHKKDMGEINFYAFFVKDSLSKIHGGIKGATCYGCLHIDYLWVSAELRGQGWGKALMEKAEKLGRMRQCLFSILSTMDWEALPFYQKLGYEIELVREGFHKESKMFLLRKNLI